MTRAHWLVAGGLAAALAGGAAFTFLAFTGPRMASQPHLRAYDAPMKRLDPGSVPLQPAPEPPSAAAAADLANPLPATPENLARGAAHYRHYCLACHGARGDGHGPVGEAYHPRPADLRAARLAALSDGELLRGSLTGLGHAPVLARVVPEHAWWPLVLHLRTLGRAP